MNKILLALTFASLAACGGGQKPRKPEPKPTPTGALACSVEIALACPADTTDGCGDGRTVFHVCVADGETAGPPCTQEIAKVCGEGQVDACLATPAYAENHVCVYAPAEESHAANSCPSGQSFYAPGCQGTPLANEGCYAPCPQDASCGDGLACKTVGVDPCHDQTCDACGAEVELCVPAS